VSDYSSRSANTRSTSDRQTPFASGGRTRDGMDWVGPNVLPELYTPAERSVRKYPVRHAENLAEWQVEKKLSKAALEVWDGTLYSEGIQVPEAPLTLQQVNEYAEMLSAATVQRVNRLAASVSRRW
jgi:hypothetical protein